MDCDTCAAKAIITLQHGNLCRHHFLDYFEHKVFKTIAKYELIKRTDTLCVASSGGKDSLTVLYLTKKYCEKNNLPATLFALAIDEGIHNYRAKTLQDLELFCTQHHIPVKVIKTKEEFKHTLDEAYPLINKDAKKKPCNICGVWRRYLLNKYARKNGATKVITGHNLDDEAQAIIMNVFKANTGLAAHLGPISGVQDHELFVRRVKPLYFCTEKETRLYAWLKGFTIEFTECPYAREGYRAKVQEMLNDFEQQYAGTKQGIVNSFLAILPLLKEKELPGQKNSIQLCQECREPAQGEICNACKIQRVLEHEQ